MWIAKEGGKKRPIGKPCFEDKSVQRAVGMIVEAIFAQDFQECSHGVRKGHSPHQALHALREPCRKLTIHWIVDADVSGVFDTIDQGHLRACIKQRVHDGGILRLIGTWLKAGVREAGTLPYPDKGTPPGGVAAPIRATVLLHHVLDEWVVKDGQPRMKGRCFLTRFAEDCIIGFEEEADAHRVMAVLPTRFGRFSLTIHPEKTGLVECKKPLCRERSANGKGTFDVLGFTHYGAKTRRGDWGIKRKTVGKRLRRFMKEIGTGCRENRHEPVQEQ